jgi:simple sugar transport system ATP-binding protein
MIARAAVAEYRGPAGAGRAAGAAPLISFRSVTKRFPGVVANDAVSFSVLPGEVHALLGENGAGKSTLIGMLAGMQQPDSGEILVDGRAARIGSPRHALGLGIGTVFQHSMLAPELTIAENLMLGGRWWAVPDRRGLRARFHETCAAFGLEIDPDASAGALSLGERQQVEIIRAIWRGGKAVVLDEPTAMLTPQGIEELGRVMRRMAERGIAVVFITHKLREALDYGDRVTVLRLGRVVGDLGPEALRDRPRPEVIDCIISMMFGEAATADPEAPAFAPRRAVGTAVLEVRGVAMEPGPAHPGLHDISFSVGASEIFGIAGIDGNGQNQLAELLAGQSAGSGSVLLDGLDLRYLDVGGRTRAGLRYTTDDRLGEGTVAALPVALNLLLKQIGEPPFWRLGMARAGAIEANAARLVREFDIRTPSVATPIGRLSGGNIQKALLARELQPGVRVLICNKPTHGLDVRKSMATRARIRAGAAQGIATVLISTDLEEVLAMADRIGVMVRGRMVGIVDNGPEARAVVGRLMSGMRHVD